MSQSTPNVHGPSTDWRRDADPQNQIARTHLEGQLEGLHPAGEEEVQQLQQRAGAGAEPVVGEGHGVPT